VYHSATKQDPALAFKFAHLMLKSTHNYKEPKVGKLSSNHFGFSVVEALLILVALGVLGATGWYVLHAKNKVDNPHKATKTHTTKPQTSVRPPKPSFVLPAGWTWYDNKDLGFKFAYPASWGQAKAADQSNLLLNVYTDEYDDSASQVRGRINLFARSDSSFTLVPRKYDVTVKPVDHGAQWQITEVNPVVAGQYEVGEMYNLQGKQNVNGGVMYFLSSTDEGCKMNTYIFVLKAAFAELHTPNLCSMTTVSSANEAAFDKTTNTIISSITIY
jgi:hypothetical protein